MRLPLGPPLTSLMNTLVSHSDPALELSMRGQSRETCPLQDVVYMTVAPSQLVPGERGAGRKSRSRVFLGMPQAGMVARRSPADAG